VLALRVICCNIETICLLPQCVFLCFVCYVKFRIEPLNSVIILVFLMATDCVFSLRRKDLIFLCNLDKCPYSSSQINLRFNLKCVLQRSHQSTGYIRSDSNINYIHSMCLCIETHTHTNTHIYYTHTHTYVYIYVCIIVTYALLCIFCLNSGYPD